MRPTISVLYVACAMVLASMVTGCNGGTHSFAPQAAAGADSASLSASQHTSTGVSHRANWISPEVERDAQKGGLLFVSDAQGNVVDIFSKANPTKPIGQIVDLVSAPQALKVDAKGDLYVVNGGYFGILKFAPPYTKPPVDIIGFGNGTTTKGNGSDLAFGSDGTLYEAQAFCCLAEFAPGSNSITSLVFFPANAEAGVAVDAHDNVYMSAEPFGANGSIYEIAHGSTISTNLLIALNAPYGMTFDPQGKLIVANTGDAVIDIYARPVKRARPVHIIRNGLVAPRGVALDASRGLLYVADSGAFLKNNSVVQVIAYGTRKTVRKIYGFQSASGVAIAPGQSNLAPR